MKQRIYNLNTGRFLSAKFDIGLHGCPTPRTRECRIDSWKNGR